MHENFQTTAKVYFIIIKQPAILKNLTYALNKLYGGIEFLKL